jgi:uncharacterized protein (DUF305 family)
VLETIMPFLPFRRFGFRPALLVTMTITAAAFAACSDQSRSLADYIASICAAHFQSASKEEAPFLADNVDAMSKMMVDMGITPTGDIDRDFVAMMVPHHQGAIDMAKAELRYGHNEQLRRMAQEIIVTQQQEIAAMRLAIGQAPSSSPVANQRSSAVSNDQSALR